MSEKDNEDLKQFVALKEAGVSALKAINDEYNEKADQIDRLNRIISRRQIELDKLERAIQIYKDLSK